MDQYTAMAPCVCSSTQTTIKARRKWFVTFHFFFTITKCKDEKSEGMKDSHVAATTTAVAALLQNVDWPKHIYRIRHAHAHAALTKWPPAPRVCVERGTGTGRAVRSGHRLHRSLYRTTSSTTTTSNPLQMGSSPCVCVCVCVCVTVGKAESIRDDDASPFEFLCCYLCSLYILYFISLLKQ